MRPAALLLALALAGCTAERGGDPLAPPGAASPVGDAAGPVLALPARPDLAAPAGPALAPVSPAPAAPAGSAPTTPAGPGPDQAAVQGVPQIYMALQPDPGGPTSVILAIDRSRDNTPSDDPAIRITPDKGSCNPQQLRRFEFPPDRVGRPTYGPDDAARGVTARELPEYMATAVTSEMVATGLIADQEDSQPQKVCTRKLLQRLIIDRSTAAG